MAYSPKTWQNGDTIYASDMNKIEQGVAAGGVLWITATWDDTANGYLLDKTAAQIKAASTSGQLCKVIGAIESEVSVMSAPWGDLFAFTSGINVDVANNELICDQFDFDPTTEVLTSTEYIYTLTPAS